PTSTTQPMTTTTLQPPTSTTATTTTRPRTTTTERVTTTTRPPPTSTTATTSSTTSTTLLPCGGRFPACFGSCPAGLKCGSEHFLGACVCERAAGPARRAGGRYRHRERYPSIVATRSRRYTRSRHA